jgi:hypothetical protein
MGVGARHPDSWFDHPYLRFSSAYKQYLPRLRALVATLHGILVDGVFEPCPGVVCMTEAKGAIFSDMN